MERFDVGVTSLGEVDRETAKETLAVFDLT
jgi:hypothetical protein